jgi:hypothetical protein
MVDQRQYTSFLGLGSYGGKGGRGWCGCGRSKQVLVVLTRLEEGGGRRVVGEFARTTWATLVLLDTGPVRIAAREVGSARLQQLVQPGSDEHVGGHSGIRRCLVERLIEAAGNLHTMTGVAGRHHDLLSGASILRW